MSHAPSEPGGVLARRVERYEHEGLVFDVRDTGPLDGDPVVLLHGFPERASCWDAVAPLLHEHGLRTLAPDQRGYSPGARPRRRRDHRVQHLVDDVVALAESQALGGRAVHLVGHDWGAVVAWYVAAQRPDLVRTLTAVSVPHPLAYLRSVATSTQLFKSWYMLVFQVPGLVERLARTRRFDQVLLAGGMTESEVARFRREMVGEGALRGGLMWYRALPMPARRLLDAQVQVPTTLLWSDGDRFVGEAGARWTPRYVEADYRYERLPGVSHWVPGQAPEVLAAVALERITGQTR